MARVPTAPRPRAWTPPQARIDGDRLLKARQAEQRVMEAKAKVEAEAKRVEEMESQKLDEKVDVLREQLDRLTDDLPKIIPSGGGGKRMVAKVLDRDFPALVGLPLGGDLGKAIYASEDGDEASAIPEFGAAVRRTDHEHLDWQRYSIDATDEDFDSGPGFADMVDDALSTGKQGLLPIGTLVIDEPILRQNTGVLSLKGVQGQTIIKGTQRDGYIMRFDGDSAGTLVVEGVWFNNSLRTYLPAASSGTALSLTRMRYVYATRNRFTGASGALAPVDGQPWGDSGITATDCNNVWIVDNITEHQPDNGFYLSGDATFDSEDRDGFGWVVSRNIIRYCNGGAKATRQAQRVLMSNNLVHDCRSGLSGRSAATNPQPRSMMVHDNWIERCYGGGPLAFGHVAALSVKNNVVMDWGIEEDLVTPGSNIRGLTLYGAYGAHVSGNMFKRRAFVDGSQAGMWIMESEASAEGPSAAGAFQSLDNVVTNNTFDTLAEGIRERNTSDRNVGNNMFINVTTPIVKESGSGTNSKWGYSTEGGVNRLAPFTVGKDSTTTTSAGVVIGESNVNITRSSATPLEINRLTDDGAMATFRRDGSSVGSITTASVGRLFADMGIRLPSFTVATLPAADVRHLIYVSDGTSNKRLAVSDGTNWRWPDGAIVS